MISRRFSSFLFTFLAIIAVLVVEFGALMAGPSHFGRRGFLGGLAPIPASGSVVPTDLGLILQYAGDQVITLPDGAYTTAQINYLLSTRAHTAGTYGGWLIIAAQNKWGATVDLTANGFNLGPQGGLNKNYRVLFVGIDFSDGDIALWNANYVRFWHCRSSFPGASYRSQYIAAGGVWGTYDAAVINRMANPNCRGVGTVGELAVGAPYNSFIGCLGHTFVDIANDGVYSQGTTFLDLSGSRWINVYHHLLTPPGPGGTGQLFHSDAGQVEWGTCILIDQVFVGGDLQLECHDSGINSLAFTNSWQAGSPGVGVTLDPMGHSFTGSVIRNVRTWGNGQYQSGSNTFTALPSYDSGYDKFFLNAATGSTTVAPSGVAVSGVTIGAPASVTVTSGLITDLPSQATALADATNPANVWAAANPYGSWKAYFDAGRTNTDAVTTSGSATVTSATGGFTGRLHQRVQAPGIPADTYIGIVNSDTSIGLSSSPTTNTPVNAMASATGVTLVVDSGGWP